MVETLLKMWLEPPSSRALFFSAQPATAWPQLPGEDWHFDLWRGKLGILWMRDPTPQRTEGLRAEYGQGLSGNPHTELRDWLWLLHGTPWAARLIPSRQKSGRFFCGESDQARRRDLKILIARILQPKSRSRYAVRSSLLARPTPEYTRTAKNKLAFEGCRNKSPTTRYRKYNFGENKNAQGQNKVFISNILRRIRRDIVSIKQEQHIRWK